jgi:hypothetical protein
MADTYQAALRRANRKPAVELTDAEQMAAWCHDALQVMVGAASPQLVWEGAQAAGMTTLELNKLAVKDWRAVHDLMW